jgi:hypothetical protein
MPKPFQQQEASESLWTKATDNISRQHKPMTAYRNDKNKNEEQIVKAPDEARAATTGHGVRYVLVFGTLATAVLFLIVYLYTFA